MADVKRSRLLEYLPAIYRQSPYLEKFLLPFEEVFFGSWVSPKDGGTQEGVAPVLDRIDAFFDTVLTPSDFLPWLAGWVALDLDEEWDEGRRRQYIWEALDLYRWRGTVRGLTRFLEIYTGKKPQIRECRWPAGMQIGVASMIGGMVPDTRFASLTAQRLSQVSHDYYVVTEGDAPQGTWYYRADRVRRVDVDTAAMTVKVIYFQPDQETTTEKTHSDARVTRRDGLPDTDYLLTGIPVEGGEEVSAEYHGDTVFIGEEEMPYRFIVDVEVDAGDMDKVLLDKVRAIVDLEKPAHTLYYLRMIPLYRDEPFEAMQIGVGSRIGSDAIIG
jgi:phage tail-like protein